MLGSVTNQNNVNIDYVFNNNRHNYTGGTKRAHAHVYIVATLEEGGIINTNVNFLSEKSKKAL